MPAPRSPTESELGAEVYQRWFEKVMSEEDERPYGTGAEYAAGAAAFNTVAERRERQRKKTSEPQGASTKGTGKQGQKGKPDKAIQTPAPKEGRTTLCLTEKGEARAWPPAEYEGPEDPGASDMVSWPGDPETRFNDTQPPGVLYDAPGKPIRVEGPLTWPGHCHYVLRIASPPQRPRARFPLESPEQRQRYATGIRRGTPKRAQRTLGTLRGGAPRGGENFQEKQQQTG